MFLLHFSSLLHLASTGGVDCVHLTHHNVSGVGKMVAAGSRDHLVYLWKLREQTRDEEAKEGARAMRPYTTTQLSKHRVRSKWKYLYTELHVSNKMVGSK